MRIETRLQAFDEQRLALLAEVEALEPAELDARPLTGKWSIREIVEHLVIAERSVFQALAEPLGLREGERRLAHRIRYQIVLFVLRFGIPVRVPSPAMVPRGGVGLNELRRLWDESQGWVRAYLGAAGSAGARRAVLAHPVAGPLTVDEAVRLNQIHFSSHRRQIEKRRLLLAARA